ncbi:MAG TPA: ADYC domain-containing protein [Kofleriaceae bacterium]
MRHVRMKALACVVVAGCIAIQARPDESEVESELATSQGSDFQGSDFQGSDFQGTTYQGAHWQYTSLDGVRYGEASIVIDAALSGTTLSVWKFRGVAGDLGWDQRFPDKICHWNVDRTEMSSCDVVDLATSPSPIVGTIWKATFLGSNGSAFEADVRIGVSTGEIGAVQRDPSSAMHALKNHGQGASCAVEQVSPSGCTNPGGCRKNCDLWLYDVRLDGVPDENGAPRRFCPPGHSAYAIAGTYSKTGEYDPKAARKFTFGCTTGTIAKCTKWGYRPFGSASKVNLAGLFAKTTVPLVDFHQPCIRAARADYCSSGRTYTKPGTLIDISDADKKSGYGLIHDTRSVTGPIDPATAFVFEARFDHHSAEEIDHVRYQEMVQLFPTLIPTDCFAHNYTTTNGDGALKRKPSVATPTVPVIKVESTTACAHSEQTPGKFLHQDCSTCTKRIATSNVSPWEFLHCTQPMNNRGWDSACTMRAAQLCSAVVDPYKMMAQHGECTVGVALSVFDTGCTIKVCGQKPSCCDSGGSGAWDAECVSIANASCYGGRENATVGFCGL